MPKYIFERWETAVLADNMNDLIQQLQVKVCENVLFKAVHVGQRKLPEGKWQAYIEVSAELVDTDDDKIDTVLSANGRLDVGVPKATPYTESDLRAASSLIFDKVDEHMAAVRLEFAGV